MATVMKAPELAKGKDQVAETQEKKIQRKRDQVTNLVQGLAENIEIRKEDKMKKIGLITLIRYEKYKII